MRIRQQLILRGYWQEAGDGGAAGGGAGGAAAGDPPVGGATPPAEGGKADGGEGAGQGQGEAGAKPDGEAGEKPGDKGEATPKAPEAYDFKAPEGVESLDAKLVEAFSPLAKKLDLTNEQAQELVNLAPQIQQRLAEQQAEAWGKQLEAWVGEVKADKDIGGDNLPASMASAQKVMQQFGTPELKEALEQTGMGNHPELVRLFVKVGKAISEDGIVAGVSGGGTQSMAQRMFPNMNP